MKKRKSKTEIVWHCPYFHTKRPYVVRTKPYTFNVLCKYLPSVLDTHRTQSQREPTRGPHSDHDFTRMCARTHTHTCQVTSKDIQRNVQPELGQPPPCPAKRTRMEPRGQGEPRTTMNVTWPVRSSPHPQEEPEEKREQNRSHHTTTRTCPQGAEVSTCRGTGWREGREAPCIPALGFKVPPHALGAPVCFPAMKTPGHADLLTDGLTADDRREDALPRCRR